VAVAQIGVLKMVDACGLAASDCSSFSSSTRPRRNSSWRSPRPGPSTSTSSSVPLAPPRCALAGALREQERHPLPFRPRGAATRDQCRHGRTAIIDCGAMGDRESSTCAARLLPPRGNGRQCGYSEHWADPRSAFAPPSCAAPSASGNSAQSRSPSAARDSARGATPFDNLRPCPLGEAPLAGRHATSRNSCPEAVDSPASAR
jgi:hypothetical protein